MNVESEQRFEPGSRHSWSDDLTYMLPRSRMHIKHRAKAKRAYAVEP